MNNPADVFAHLRELSRVRWERFEHEFARTRKKINAEQVHDLRVSIRRLRAVIRLKDSLFPDKNIPKLTHPLRKLMTPLGDYRDTQIQLGYLEQIKSPLPYGLQLYRHRLQKDSESYKQKINTLLSEFDITGYQKKIHKDILPWKLPPAMLHKQDSNSWPDWQDVLKVSLEKIRKHEEDLFREGGLKDFHQMRIALKQFRYLCELLQGLTPVVTVERIKELASLQTLMGDIHDQDVLALGCLKFSQTLYPNHSGYQDIATLVNRIKESRRKKMSRLKKELDSFGESYRVLQPSVNHNANSSGKNS